MAKAAARPRVNGHTNTLWEVYVDLLRIDYNTIEIIISIVKNNFSQGLCHFIKQTALLFIYYG